MSSDRDQAAASLRNIWQADDAGVPELDAECSPTKACRNMKDISFEGFAEEGGDIATAWRNTLAREGKLGSGTVADLVFGNGN